MIVPNCSHLGADIARFTVPVEKTFDIGVDVPCRYVLEIFQLGILPKIFSKPILRIFVAFDAANTVDVTAGAVMVRLDYQVFRLIRISGLCLFFR